MPTPAIKLNLNNKNSGFKKHQHIIETAGSNFGDRTELMNDSNRAGSRIIRDNIKQEGKTPII